MTMGGTLGAGLAVGASAVILIGAGYLWFAGGNGGTGGEPLSPAAVEIGSTQLGGAFELTNQDGERVTSDQVIDGPTLVYFGYTFCPDVCPVDTAVMVDAVRMLEDRGIAVTPVFVTVDPARDDPEALSHWVDAHHPDMIALTGTAEEIRAAADAYKVYFARVEQPDSAAGYLMNHSAFTYLMTPDGLAALFRNGYDPEGMADEVERVLKARGAV